MNTKQTEALKLARDFISAEWGFGGTTDIEPSKLVRMLDEVLAEQPAQGCEFCSHPLYAGTKCKNCGREQPANQLDDINVVDIPKIGCVNHDCDRCKAQQQEPFVTKNINGITLHVGWDDLPVGTKLYKSPPASKPLTDEEIKRMAAPWFLSMYWPLCNTFARAIEAAHGIGEKPDAA